MRCHFGETVTLEMYVTCKCGDIQFG